MAAPKEPPKLMMMFIQQHATQLQVVTPALSNADARKQAKVKWLAHYSNEQLGATAAIRRDLPGLLMERERKMASYRAARALFVDAMTEREEALQGAQSVMAAAVAGAAVGAVGAVGAAQS